MNKPYILWADDDQDDLFLIREILEELNLPVDVKEVQNGREALDCLYQAKKDNDLPCLIVLDINMPIMDGKETLFFIKANETLKDIPIVIFSTSNSELDRTYFGKFHVEMLTKPPQYKPLKEAVQRLITFCN